MTSTALERPAFDVVVIATSAGGLHALRQVLGPVPAFFSAPVLAVQHLPSRGDNHSLLVELLAPRLNLPVQWAKQGDRPRAGQVYMAPPGRHLRIDREGACDVSPGAPINFTCPAADPLFESAAAVFGDRVLAVVLTGRLRDGLAGAAAVRRAGGVVLAQDPRTCVAPDMPRAAIEGGAVNFVLPLPSIAAALVSLVMVPGARALFGASRTAA